MKKIIILTFIFLINSVSSHALTVLIYHKIGDNRTPTTNLSIKKFKNQMLYLKENHYKVLSLKKVITMLKNHRKCPEKSVVLTFDDGYESIYKNAFPIIKKYKYPISVFLPTEAIEKRYPDYMNIAQIKDMMKYNVDFESHSYSHPHMIFKSRSFIKNEIRNGIKFFTKNFHYKPYAFAIPYGEYNKTVIECAKSAGFDTILTQDSGAVDKNTDVYLIPREPILGNYYSSMEHFKNVLNETALDIKRRYPNIGKLNQNPPHIIGAEILNIKKYKKNSFKIFLSELGWKHAKIKNNLVYIEITRTLHRKKDRIGIEAIEKNTNRHAKTFWMITP